MGPRGRPGVGVKLALTGDWAKSKKLLVRLEKNIRPATVKAVNLEAIYLAGKIKERIGAGPPPPLKKYPGGKRKGSKPLNNTGALRQSVSFVQYDLEAFVGILRTASGHGGKAANLGAIHENGAVIVQRMTAKQRRFLFGVLMRGGRKGARRATGSGSGIIVIRIPPRPFVRPVFEAEGTTFQARFQARLLALLGLKG